MKPFTAINRPLIFSLFLLGITACVKEYSFEGAPNPAAAGTLKDTTAWECMPETVTGTFYGGVAPGRDTAYLLVNVNVSRIGTYSIYSNTVNGYYFSDSGYFAATGLNTIKLKPIGTPITPGINTFTVTFDTSICGVTVNVRDSTGLVGSGPVVSNWQFTTPAGLVSGINATAVTASLGNITEIGVTGTTITGDSSFTFSILLNEPSIPPTAQVETSGIHGSFKLSAGAGIIYESDVATPGKVVTLDITYSTASKKLKGTFSGTAKGPNGDVPITNGKFDVFIH